MRSPVLETLQKPFKRLARLLVNTQGGVSPILTLMLVPLIGIMGMGVETAGWYLTQRAAQNAADAAAMAAASNNLAAYYANEAAAVASRYNFVNGTSNTTVTTANNVSCPGVTPAKSECYQVTITRLVPITLLRAVGFNGDTTASGSPAQTVIATAIARPKVKTGYCLITTNNGKAKKDETLVLNGTTDLKGCDVFVKGNAKCSGDSGIGIVYATGTDQKCGVTENENVAIPADVTARLNAFAALSSNIPTATCTKTGNFTMTTAAGAPSPYVVCNGTLTISGTVTMPANQVIVVRNGNLAVGSTAKLTAPSMTLVFDATGTTTPGFITGSGTLDFNAPSSGTWSGVAFYQHQATTNTTANTATYAGNSPTLKVTGLVYAPYSDMTFSGNVSKNGKACLSFIVSSITANGGNFFENITSECEVAGLNLPTSDSTLVRQALLQ